MAPTIADQIIRAFRVTGIDTLFCLPGVQNDDFFGALLDAPDIRPIVTRHEQGAAYMAMGAAQATGRPAAFNVVPGPGMLNAAAALTSAYWGNARVLAVVGEIPTTGRGRGFGLLHELEDQHAILAQLTKRAVFVDDGDRAAGDIQGAADALVSGRPRPVSIEVPADRWLAPAPGTIRPPAVVPPLLDQHALERAADAIRHAERPLIVAGGGAQDAGEAVRVLAEHLQAPVTTRRMGHGVLPTAHPLVVPLPVGRGLAADADVVIGIGSRMELPLMRWRLSADTTVVKIDIDEAELDRHDIGTIGVVGDADDVCRALMEALSDTPPARDRTEEIARARDAFRPTIERLRPQIDYLDAIRDVLPDDGVLVDEMTQIAYASQLAFEFRTPRGLLSTGPAGTLGSGYATALGAQVALSADGGRRALAICGDGGFLFTANELATAVQYDIPLVAAVFADGAYGNVKRMQEQKFGDRAIASTLHNPDFAAFAASFGATGMHVRDPHQFRHALDEAFAADGPVVIQVDVGPMPDPWPIFFGGPR